MITLRNARLRAAFSTEIGGGLTRFDLHADDRWLPLLRPTDHPASPLDLASFPLVPWSNRIGNAAFTFEGRTYSMPRNMPNDLPLHGDGWQSPWQVVQHTDATLTLQLTSRQLPPFHYHATQQFSLLADRLRVVMSLTNLASIPLPHGLGIHPYFLRRPDFASGEALLEAPTKKMWLSGADYLPHTLVTTPDDYAYLTPTPLRSVFVNHSFLGWDGRATIRWPRAGKPSVGLALTSDVDGYVFYVPTGENFFCLEPTDHPINAINLPGGPQTHGLTILSPHATLSHWFEFTLL